MANYTYDNKVLENKYNTILTTFLDLSQFVTVDDSLTEGAGDTKRIIYRSVDGEVDEVGMGDGNTHTIETTGRYEDYTLKTTQAKGVYYDEQAQKDGKTVETLLQGMGEKMTNKWNGDIRKEYGKATYNEVAGSINFDGFCDSVAKFKEKNEGIFALVNAASLATLRKNLKEILSYSEAFARTGYIGSVVGVPVYMSEEVPAGEVIFATKEAITVFLNKKQEIETDRDKEHRKNTIFIRTVALAALTNEKKVCRLAAAATTDTTITTYTKNQKTVAGAATTGATVKVYVNGELKKTATASSSAYSVTLTDNLAVGDVVLVEARKDGQVSSSATVEVAA